MWDSKLNGEIKNYNADSHFESYICIGDGIVIAVDKCSVLSSGICCCLLAGYMHGLFFDPEYSGSTFLLNVCELLPEYMVSHPRR
jgi:hypothetical protein